MKRLKASLLAECSIGLFLIGIMLSLSANYWRAINYEKNLFTTEKKIQDIKIALEGYVVRYGFLPNAAKDEQGNSSDECLIGNIPYKAIGLSKEYLKDDFGNLFQFIVNENLTLNYHLKKSKNIVPIFLSTLYVYNPNTVSWNRLYQFNTMGVVSNYDCISSSNNIVLYKNNQEMKLHAIQCFPPIVPSILYNGSDIDEKIEKFDKNKRYKVVDLIAWVIIAGKLKNRESFNIKVDKNTYFQSRFNLAACINHATDSNSIYVDSIDENNLDLAAIT